MSRSFLWLAVALASVALLGTGVSSALAQPVATSSAAATPNPNQNYPEVLDAIKLLNNRDLNGALAKLKDLARVHAELPSEYVMMFGILARNNQPNLARAMIERAVLETRSDPEPWVILGSISLQDNRLAEAELDFLKAHELLRDYPNAQRKAVIEQSEMLGMASVAERRERWATVEDLLQKYLEKNPKDIVALQRLARALFTQGKAGKSEKDNQVGAYDVLKQAKEIDKANVAEDKTHKAREQMLPAEAYMAQYYDQFQHAHEKGKWTKCDSAETWFKYALKKAPDDLNLRTVVAVWALENGEPALAKEQADAALRIEEEDKKLPAAEQKYPASLTGLMLSGFVALWEKRFADAESAFSKVILEAPNDFAAKNNIALALVEQSEPRKKDKAAEYARANYEANKENGDALSTLSWVAFRTGNFQQAGLAMDQVIKATNGNLNADTTTYLAHILDHNNQGNQRYQAKQALKAILDSGRPFSMKPEAQILYEKLKDEKAPEATPTPTATSKAP